MCGLHLRHLNFEIASNARIFSLKLFDPIIFLINFYQSLVLLCLHLITRQLQILFVLFFQSIYFVLCCQRNLFLVFFFLLLWLFSSLSKVEQLSHHWIQQHYRLFYEIFFLMRLLFSIRCGCYFSIYFPQIHKQLKHAFTPYFRAKILYFILRKVPNFREICDFVR